MHKQEIADLLEENYHNLLVWLENHDDGNWTHGPENEWTTGQQALYLLKNIIPLNDALSMPRFLLKYVYGTANRPVRDNDSIVNQLQELLQSKEYQPTIRRQKLNRPKFKDKTYLMTRLQVESKKLQYKTRRISDKNLDTLLLPHPELGKIPIREILICNAIKVKHHTKLLQEKY